VPIEDKGAIMSASLRIGIDAEPQKTIVWMPTSGMFDRIWELISTELLEFNQPLATTLDEAVIPGFGGNLGTLTINEFQAFQLAVQKAFNRVTMELVVHLSEASANNSEIHSHYSVLIRNFSQLKALLCVDSRTLSNRLDKITVHLSHNNEWNTVIWVAELILEMLAATENILRNYTHLAFQIFNVQLNDKQYRLNIENSDEYDAVLEAVEWLEEYFRDPDRGIVAYSYIFNQTIQAGLNELSRKMELEK
jgi:hypothetical protein